MTQLYLANWLSVGDIEAMHDDRPDPEDLVFPAGILVTDPEVAKRVCFQEWKEFYEEDEPMFADFHQWVWVRLDNTYDNKHQSWSLMEGDEPIGYLTVRPIEVTT